MLTAGLFTFTVAAQEKLSSNKTVKLWISPETNSIEAGSPLIVNIRLLNDSTNTLHMIEEGADRDFVISLKSSDGNTYLFGTDDYHGSHPLRSYFTFSPGARYSWVMRVETGRALVTGNYLLQASTKKFGFKLVSNQLKLRIY